jgi:hypothetical protein
LGNTIAHQKFFLNIANTSPVELQADNAGALLFYRKNNVVYYRKVTPTSLSAEVNSQLPYNALLSTTKNCFNQTSSNALLFGIISNQLRMAEVDKITMTQTSVSIIPPPLYSVFYALETDNSHVILCGRDIANRECIGFYNTTLKDTVWEKTLSTNTGQVLKCVTDAQKNYIYTISQSASDIMVRKLKTVNGALVWSYSYNGSSGLGDSPLDISYDGSRGRLLIAGYETGPASNKNVLILVLDTSGAALDTIVKTGDFAGDNYGICTHVLTDGSEWTGGNRNTNADGPAGFIFEIDSSLLFTSTPPAGQPVGNDMLLYPNPSNGSFMLRSVENILAIEITNVLGSTICSFLPAFPHSKFDLSTAPDGIYFMLIKTEQGIRTEKLIIQK